jgi:hypothetical protein
VEHRWHLSFCKKKGGKRMKQTNTLDSFKTSIIGRIFQGSLKHELESKGNSLSKCNIEPFFVLSLDFGENSIESCFDKFFKNLEKENKATAETALEYIGKNYDVENNCFIKIVPEKLRTRDYISLIDEDMLFCDGMDAALIGYRIGFGIDKNIAAYDYEKCVQCLVDEGMEYEDAVEFLEYNTLGSYVGEYTPCFLYENY